MRPILLKECKQPGAGDIRPAARILWDSVRKDADFRNKLVEFTQQQVQEMKESAFHIVKLHDCFAELCTPVFRDNGFLQSLAATLEWEAIDTPYTHQGGRYIVRGTKDDLMPFSDPPHTKLDALLDKRPCFDLLRQGFFWGAAT